MTASGLAAAGPDSTYRAPCSARAAAVIRRRWRPTSASDSVGACASGFATRGGEGQETTSQGEADSLKGDW